MKTQSIVLVVAGLSVLLLACVGMTKGVMFSKGSFVSREERPFAFWFLTGCWLSISMVLLFFGATGMLDAG